MSQPKCEAHILVSFLFKFVTFPLHLVNFPLILVNFPLLTSLARLQDHVELVSTDHVSGICQPKGEAHILVSFLLLVVIFPLPLVIIPSHIGEFPLQVDEFSSPSSPF
jgi:hypothetical protein